MQAATLALLGAAADLDLLMGHHSAQAHSVGAAAIVASVGAWRAWPIASSRVRIWWAVFAAWLSHPLLDALAFDTSPPIGVMALWPFSPAYFQTGLSVFAPISRAFWAPGFLSKTLLAVGREVFILGLVTLVVWRLRRQAPGLPGVR